MKSKNGIARLIEIAGTKKWWLFGSMILAVAATLALFTPYFSIYYILMELAQHANSLETVDKALVWRWAWISLGAILIYGGLFFCSNMLSHIAAFNILYELRMAVSRKLARMPLGFFNKRTSGEIKKIMSEDVERIELFVAHHIPDIISAFVMPLLTMTYLYIKDWRLALVVTFIFIIAVVSQIKMMFNSKARERMEQHQQTIGRMNASIVEYIRGIQVVKVFNRSIDAFQRLRQNILDVRDFSLRVTRDFAFVYTAFLTVLSSTLLFIVPASVILLIQAPDYAAYIPTVFLFLVLGAGMFFPLIKLMWISGWMTQNSIGVGLIDEILNKAEIAEPAQPQTPSDASVVFEDVTFGYEEKDVLKNVSLTAAPGTVTALVGPSGAGKSTVAMLAARFWDVKSGRILIGKQPIDALESKTLMEHVAFVFQDNMLFYDTIEENIRMGNRDATFTQVQEAARAAQCHDFIEKLDFGYATLVGEGGTYLSGGEQQRIALARAILKDAPIVLLDEATAYADPENEGKILEAFSKLIKGKTVLVIAHRLSTITSADQILVIDEGRVVEQGDHDTLIKQQGLYRRMWEAYRHSRQWVFSRKGE